jgi:hypothetical protein
MANFMKILWDVNGALENHDFFDISKGHKSVALTMSEKAWLH